MPGKQIECNTCHKSMRSDNLVRHKKVCKGENNVQLSGFANGMVNNNRDSEDESTDDDEHEDDPNLGNMGIEQGGGEETEEVANPVCADPIFDINEPLQEEDSIKSYEYSSYLPTSGSNLNTPGTITIHIESHDAFYHPRRSYLLVEGELVKEDGTRYTTPFITAPAGVLILPGVHPVCPGCGPMLMGCTPVLPG